MSEYNIGILFKSKLKMRKNLWLLLIFIFFDNPDCWLVPREK